MARYPVDVAAIADVMVMCFREQRTQSEAERLLSLAFQVF